MIGWGQLLLLVLVSRMAAVYSFPGSGMAGNGDFLLWEQLLGMVISLLLQAVLLLPSVRMRLQSSGEPGLRTEAQEKKGFSLFVFLADLLPLLALLFLAGQTAVDFADFLSVAFSPRTIPWLAALLLLAAGAYGAFLGIQGIARAGVLVFGAAVVGWLLLILAAFGKPFFWENALEAVRLREVTAGRSDNWSRVLQAAWQDFSHSGEILAAVVLYDRVRATKGGNFRTGLYGGLAARLVFLAFTASLTASVLGPYANMTAYPLHTLSAYLKLGVLERMDGVFLLLWGTSMTVRAGFLIFSAAVLLKGMIPAIRMESWISGVLSFLVSLGMIYGGKYLSMRQIEWPNWILPTVFAVSLLIFPLFQILQRRIKKE